jgi:hypothetical protein
MNTVVEFFEIKKNQFSKWLFAVLTLFSFFALAISWKDEGSKKWIAAAGMLLFGSGWLMAIRHRIIVYQGGFELQTVGKSRTVKWQEITSLSFDMVYHGHGVEARLDIHYAGKIVSLPVKQYQRDPMQRFFEVLFEQCGSAAKNEHFIKQATGTMDWRSRIKMF